MNQILQKTDLSEAEKAQKYGETLFKLQHSLEKTKKTPSTDSPQPTDQPQPPSTVALHDQILQSVPKTMQRKAELLLGMIKNNNNLTWDEQGVDNLLTLKSRYINNKRAMMALYRSTG